MKSRLQATPTEYKGVLYRSKCEAMFARYLDLVIAEDCSYAPESHGGFQYEPKFLSVGGWTPDFLKWQVSIDNDRIPFLYQDVIEYKPSKPTDAHIATFKKRCLRISEFIADTYGSAAYYRTSYQLYYGSVFNASRGFFDTFSIAQDEIGFYFDGSDWLHDYAKDLSSYRFDLKEHAPCT